MEPADLPAPEDTGPARCGPAAARILVERANPPGTWSAHPRGAGKVDWLAWRVSARSYSGNDEVTLIPGISEDNANAIAAAMNWVLPLADRLAAVGRSVGDAQRIIRNTIDDYGVVPGLHPEVVEALNNALAALARVRDADTPPEQVDLAGLTAEPGGIVEALAREVEWLRDQRADLLKRLGTSGEGR